MLDSLLLTLQLYYTLLAKMLALFLFAGKKIKSTCISDLQHALLQFQLP